MTKPKDPAARKRARREREREGRVFVGGGTHDGGPVGTYCPDCLPSKLSSVALEDDEVQIWREYGSGWVSAPICDACSIAIAVYVDRAPKTAAGVAAAAPAAFVCSHGQARPGCGLYDGLCEPCVDAYKDVESARLELSVYRVIIAEIEQRAGALFAQRKDELARETRELADSFALRRTHLERVLVDHVATWDAFCTRSTRAAAVAGAIDWSIGDRVQRTVNDYDNGVFNGDEGVVIALSPLIVRFSQSSSGPTSARVDVPNPTHIRRVPK